MKKTIRIILATLALALVVTGLSNYSSSPIRTGQPYWQTTGGQPEKKAVSLVPEAQAYGLNFHVDRYSKYGINMYTKWNCQGHRQYVLPGHSGSSYYIWWSFKQQPQEVIRAVTTTGMKTYPASNVAHCRTLWTYSPYTNIKAWFQRV